MKREILFSILIILFHCQWLVSQESRLALVIGNSQYKYGGTLVNPINDARAMTVALQSMGFDVIKHENLDQDYMRRVIDEFGLKLKEYKVGLFFYAGHGVQSKGINYLIPTDAEIWSENDVEYNCVAAGRVLAKMEDAGNMTNIVILDACRDNPFERCWTRSAKGRGLAFMNAPAGSIIAYATAPGTTASDGAGENGLYTSALLNCMSEPGLRIEDVFKRVRVKVKQASSEEQVPWESTSLEGDFYFVYGTQNPPQSEYPQVNLFGNYTEEFRGIEGSFYDSRDGQVYDWVRIGKQIWMAQNLNFYTPTGSWCYEELQIYCDIYGRLYNWIIAKNICPEGWHLPDNKDWAELKKAGWQ